MMESLGSPLRDIVFEQFEIGIPLVSDDLAAGEATHRNDLKNVQRNSESHNMLMNAPFCFWRDILGKAAEAERG